MPDDSPTDDTALGTQSAALEVGLRVFGSFVLKRFLGRGPLGSAWLAAQEGANGELTMRFVPEAWLRDERVLSRLREAVLRSREIVHPGLIRVLDLERDAQAAAIVSEYVEAESVIDLKARQQERCFEIETLRPWLSQACDALDTAWRQHQAIHGDLMPGNLFVTPGSEMKIADFGLARSLVDLDAASGGSLLAVNLGHSSPHRARGGVAGMADEVYALGATIYDLATTRPPFFRANVRLQLESVVPPKMSERRAELNIVGASIPPEWDEVVAACLEKLPEARPQSVREVAERLGLLAPLPETGAAAQAPSEVIAGIHPPAATVAGPGSEFPDDLPTVSMEAPKMTGAALPLESGVTDVPVVTDARHDPHTGLVEAAPATVDECLDLEATITELPPPQPMAEAGHSAEADDDLSATIAADPAKTAPPAAATAERPPSAAGKSGFVAPPGISVGSDDAEATIAADDPLPRPAATEPDEPDLDATMAGTPAPVPSIVSGAAPFLPPSPPTERTPKTSSPLEDSVTLPAAGATPSRSPSVAPTPPPPPQQRSRGKFPWGWALVPVALVGIAILGATLGRQSGTIEPAPDPVAIPEPSAEVPVAASTPEPEPPSTPSPATPAPAGRAVGANDLEGLAGSGEVAEPLLLIGPFRVSTSTPASGSRPGSLVMRPSDRALSGQMRVIATLSPSAQVPAEGAEMTLAPESRYFIKEVRRGLDGQLNVEVQQR